VILILLLIALAPGIFLAWYFYHRDSYEPEPKLKIIKIFIIGGILVFPAALGEIGIMSLIKINTNALFHIFILSFLIIAPIEELLKYYAVRRWIYNSVEFDEAMDGIVYTVAASLGFATVENVLYVIQHGIGTGILRAFLAVPGHALFGALMGSYLGRAKFRPDKETKLIITGILLAIFCHGLYDFLVLTRSSFSSMVILLLGILFLWTRIQLKKAGAESQMRIKAAGHSIV
jgi:RsiW-degrading membrane proteinase PrsW (M82 family)